MKRTIFALALTVFLLGSLAVVPLAKAAMPAQEMVPGDDPNAPHAVAGNANAFAATDNGAEVVVNDARSYPGGVLGLEAETRAYWTEDRMAAATIQEKPDGIVVDQTASGTGPLVQADGSAVYAAGANPGAAESASVAGTLSGASTQIPALTFPVPFTSSGINIPIIRRPFGKLYYHVPAGDFYCSGTNVTSGTFNYDLVMTEGWCLYQGGAYTTLTLWAPATQYGGNPYGTYTMDREWVTATWLSSGGTNWRYDVGLWDAYDGGVGTNSPGWLAGSQGVATNQPSFQEFWAFGYPDPPNNVTYVCTSALAKLEDASGNQRRLGIGCDLGGAWGSPWIISGKVANKGFMNSVLSTLGAAANEWVGPYFANQVGALMNAGWT